jgi:hypothetical protein
MIQKKTTKNLSQDSWCAGGNLNRAPFESKSKLLPLNQPAQFSYLYASCNGTEMGEKLS